MPYKVQQADRRNMIARVHIILPFQLFVPEGREFKLHPYDDEGYRVIVYPPVKTDRPAPGTVPDAVEINNAPAFVANGLRIDFHKSSFDRTVGKGVDPPIAIIQRATDSFLTRLRYVTRGAHLQALPWPKVSWRLRYLNDDESELPEQEGVARGHGTAGFSVSFAVVSTEVWDYVHSLPPRFEPPAWDVLRLDANNAIGHVGTAVVLAATCLEVFITHILDSIALKGAVPKPLWEWINRRGDWLREPSTEEQFDSLLKFLAGHSLKENPKLWEAFKNLKTARNSFVHEGMAKIGGKSVCEQDALNFIVRANEIIAMLRDWLPVDLRWPEFALKTEFKFHTGLDKVA